MSLIVTKIISIFKWMVMILAFILIVGCSKNTTEPSEFDIQDLYKTWVHSYEEQDTYYPQLFRPIDFKEFPVSRFRMKYTFNQDSSCQWMVLSPDDAHYLQSGSWVQSRYVKSSILIHDSTGALQVNISFSITNLKQNLLEIAPIEEDLKLFIENGYYTKIDTSDGRTKYSLDFDYGVTSEICYVGGYGIKWNEESGSSVNWYSSQKLKPGITYSISDTFKFKNIIPNYPIVMMQGYLEDSTEADSNLYAEYHLEIR